MIFLSKFQRMLVRIIIALVFAIMIADLFITPIPVNAGEEKWAEVRLASEAPTPAPAPAEMLEKNDRCELPENGLQIIALNRAELEEEHQLAAETEEEVQETEIEELPAPEEVTVKKTTPTPAPAPEPTPAPVSVPEGNGGDTLIFDGSEIGFDFIIID